MSPEFAGILAVTFAGIGAVATVAVAVFNARSTRQSEELVKIEAARMAQERATRRRSAVLTIRQVATTIADAQARIDERQFTAPRVHRMASELRSAAETIIAAGIEASETASVHAVRCRALLRDVAESLEEAERLQSDEALADDDRGKQYMHAFVSGVVSLVGVARTLETLHWELSGSDLVDCVATEDEIFGGAETAEQLRKMLGRPSGEP